MRKLTPEHEVMLTLIKLDPGIRPHQIRKLLDFYGVPLLETLNDQVFPDVASRNPAEEAVVKALLSHISPSLTDEAKKAVVAEQKQTLVNWKPPKSHEHQAADRQSSKGSEHQAASLVTSSGLFRTSVSSEDVRRLARNTKEMLGQMAADFYTRLNGGQ